MSDDPLLISSRPDREPLLELYVWVAIDAKTGGEGMLSADMPIPDPDTSRAMLRHMPLMSSSRETAECLEPLAKQLQRRSLAETGHAMHIALRTYRLVDAARERGA